MHKNFKIKSKINVTPPKKVHYFVILLNIALILILVSGIFQIIMDGFKIGTLAYMGLAVAIVSGFKNRSENKEHYEFSVADTYFTPDSIVIRYGQIKQYKGKDYVVEIPMDSIHTLEFSDQLCCLHLGANVTRYVEDSNKRENGTDHFLYLDQDCKEEVLQLIQQLSGKSICYMDR